MDAPIFLIFSGLVILGTSIGIRGVCWRIAFGTNGNTYFQQITDAAVQVAVCMVMASLLLAKRHLSLWPVYVQSSSMSSIT